MVMQMGANVALSGAPSNSTDNLSPAAWSAHLAVPAGTSAGAAPAAAPPSPGVRFKR